MGTAITVIVDDATLTTIDALAEASEQSRDDIVAGAIADLVELRNWQTRQIERGVAAADRGDFASDEAVQHVRDKFRLRR